MTDNASPTAPDAPLASQFWGRQCWDDLLFMHWPVRPEQVQALLPPGLSVDTWQGDAWVGLVPFTLRVRPGGYPPLPTCARFFEVNVRTYVHVGGRHPGVWFFSMDADSTAAVLLARRAWNFNYQRADIRCQRHGDEYAFHSRRRWPDKSAAHLTVRGRGIAPSGDAAEPGTLEYFLIERYVYYVLSRSGRLVRGKVAHAPYRSSCCELAELDESLLGAAGLGVAGPPQHVCYSPGVAAEVYLPAAIGPARAGSRLPLRPAPARFTRSL